MRIGDQMAEVLAHHFAQQGEEAQRKCLDWLERVRIPEATRRLQQYPHELSGGMRQRVMLAMAMMTGPELLIADEPTTALDATVQAQVLDLLSDLMAETKTAVALITHDMGVIAQMAERVVVMRKGEIVEEGSAEDIFARPREAYTQALLEAVPRIEGGVRHGLEGLGPAPAADMAPLLTGRDLKVYFNIPSGKLFAPPRKLRAVDGVDLDLKPGETLGIVGESGCGKSTLARAVMSLVPRTAGQVTFLGSHLDDANRRAIRESREDLQIVFQDPLASLDPRMTVGSSIAEPLRSFHPNLDGDEREVRVREMMALVGLDPDLINRYPHELSGGQNQRVGIARAMILKPKVVVCDEAVSALDVSDPGADRAAAHPAAEAVRPRHAVHQPRPRRRARDQPSGDGALSRPRGGAGRGPGHLRRSAPPPTPRRCSPPRRRPIRKPRRAKARVRLLGDLPSPLDSRREPAFPEVEGDQRSAGRAVPAEAAGSLAGAFRGGVRCGDDGSGGLIDAGSAAIVVSSKWGRI